MLCLLLVYRCHALSKANSYSSLRDHCHVVRGPGHFPTITSWLINLEGKGETAGVPLFVSFAAACLGLSVTVFLFPEIIMREESKTEKDPSLDGYDDGEVVGSSVISSFGGRVRTKLKTSWIQSIWRWCN